MVREAVRLILLKTFVMVVRFAARKSGSEIRRTD